MRKHFNPGFAPQHLMSLMPVILEKTQTFLAKLDELVGTGEEFELEPLCTNLTFDIIGKCHQVSVFPNYSNSSLKTDKQVP